MSGRSGSLVATSGGSLTHYDYEPYGAPRDPKAAKPDAPTYAGALELPNGNYLMGQREYNPTTATFISPDQGGSPQPYAYAAGNPISNNDLQGLDEIEGTLTNISTISGWTSTAALAGAVTCTFVRSCAPAIPIFMQVSAATGMLSAGTAGILDSKACVVKGNCSALAADIAIGAVASRFPALGRAQAATRRPAKTVIGFAEGEGATALTARRLQHGSVHLTESGILPAWSGKKSPELIRRALVPILEHPTATFDHQLGATPVKGFLGEIEGKQVAVFVFKSGKYQGELASAFVPTENQLTFWSLR
ncbi:RHS repeat-associated core domain-containing protein [Kribbella ginsengisoli]|uniref:RHS repeat-associated core domain-containing protein n=1 Tax=Kribbella ginsengisoli TaxID=363865 RepID=A0ABP6Z3K9_9ACTN